jgi:hypothetical protein
LVSFMVLIMPCSGLFRAVLGRFPGPFGLY